MNDRIQIVPDWKLERYLLGELPPEMFSEVEKMIKQHKNVQKRIDELKKSNSEFHSQYPFETIAPKIEEYRLKRQEKNLRRLQKITSPIKTIFQKLNGLLDNFPWNKKWIYSSMAAAMMMVIILFSVPTAFINESPKDEAQKMLQEQSRAYELYSTTTESSGKKTLEKESKQFAPIEPAGVKEMTKGESDDKSIVKYKKAKAADPLKGIGYGHPKAIMQRSFAFAKDAGISSPSPSTIAESEEDFIQHNTEAYDRIYENEFLNPNNSPLSTFSIDVDTASYSNVRRFLMSSKLPPKDSVRIEELINYFTYKYPDPKGNIPFSVNVEVAVCPWNTNHELVHIGLKAKSIHKDQIPPRNLVFLLDVSGSMNYYNKLPLLKKAMGLLIKQLNQDDRVSIAVYAGASGLVLKPTSGDNKEKIMGAMNKLQSGGSTNGGAGIQLAYKVAEENFKDDGINRIILATDGDFNVGITNQGDLIRLIEEKRESGIFLTVLGFGMGNYKDSTMEKLADKGNGNYAYIDTMNEAKKVLVNEIGSTLVTVAKDVKIQVEFNPSSVDAYRLIGYENRKMKAKDFNDDKKDAGEIGAGHTITALYEVVPKGVEFETPEDEILRYQKFDITDDGDSDELLYLKLRYKKPDGKKSKLLKYPVYSDNKDYQSENFKFSAAVAAYGMLLRKSKFSSKASYEMVLKLAQASKGKDKFGYRAEFIKLVQLARNLDK
jgi:Ca-activated chloride channel family protein